MESEEKREQLYLQIRQESINRKYESQSQFDKYLITLSTASLGFSIAFIKDIKFIDLNNNWIITLSWIFFILSSCFTLFSFKSSVIAFDKQIENIDGLFSGKITEEISATSDKVTKLFNFINIIFFIFGIILTFIYILINLKNGVTS